MKYEQIIELLTPEFLKALCELTEDFKTDVEKVIIDYKIHSLKNNITTKKVISWLFQAFIFQAWIGWNRRESMRLQIHNFYHDRGISFNEQLFLYRNYEPKKPLSQEIQALIHVLSVAIKDDALFKE